MKRFRYDCQGLRLIRIEEAKPVCGQDFCDRCGDCLACYGADGCHGGESKESHLWIVYEEVTDD